MKIAQQFPHIKAIIFDLGNVIIDLDIPATDIAFQKLLGDQYSTAMKTLNEKDVFKAYEKGLIPTDTFIREIVDVSNIQEKAAIKNAWNAMLLDIPDRRYEILLETKKNYRTFCLSNTNELHINFIRKQLIETKGIENLNDYFEKVYLSHEMSMRKPDKEIFLRVLKENNLEPQNTLFIDDTEEHLMGAQKIGLQTFHMKKGKSLTQLF